MTKVIAIANQKGGVGKTTTTVNLGVCLAKQGYRVLLIDADPQGNLTDSLGWQEPDKLEITLSTIIGKLILDKPIGQGEGILHHDEGVELLPANIELSGTEFSLVNTMSRENMLRSYINEIKDEYEFILIDCMPSLGMLTINALAAADSVIIPVVPHYLPAKGMTQLMQTIRKVQRQINPLLKIEGILMSIVDSRTNLAKDIAYVIQRDFGAVVRIFKTEIPRAVSAASASAEGQSIFSFDPRGKAAEAYEKLVKEVVGNA